jgi:hypothetical protein
MAASGSISPSYCYALLLRTHDSSYHIISHHEPSKIIKATPIIILYIYIFIVIDQKVLVRSFNCESRACYIMLCWKPSRKFFRVRESNIFPKVSRKLDNVGYYNHYVRDCKRLPPTAARGPAGEGHYRISVWFWFSSLCGGACGQSHPS